MVEACTTQGPRRASTVADRSRRGGGRQGLRWAPAWGRSGDRRLNNGSRPLNAHRSTPQPEPGEPRPEQRRTTGAELAANGDRSPARPFMAGGRIRPPPARRRGIPGEEDIMLVEHAHQPGRFDPGHLPGLRPRERPAGPLLAGATRGSRPSRRPTDGLAGPTGTPAGRCGPPGSGSCWPSSLSSQADPPWTPMHDGASGGQRDPRQRSPRRPLVGLVRRSPGLLTPPMSRTRERCQADRAA